MMRTGLLAIGVIALAGAGCSRPDASKSATADGMAATSSVTRYLPEYTATGDLVLPKNFEKWVYVGS